MPMITAMPIINSKPLVISRVDVNPTEEASAKITEKKNKMAAAIPPITAIAFIIMFGVVIPDLKLVLA